MSPLFSSRASWETGTGTGTGIDRNGKPREKTTLRGASFAVVLFCTDGNSQGWRIWWDELAICLRRNSANVYLSLLFFFFSGKENKDPLPSTSKISFQSISFLNMQDATSLDHPWSYPESANFTTLMGDQRRKDEQGILKTREERWWPRWICYVRVCVCTGRLWATIGSKEPSGESSTVMNEPKDAAGGWFFHFLRFFFSCFFFYFFFLPGAFYCAVFNLWP